MRNTILIGLTGDQSSDRIVAAQSVQLVPQIQPAGGNQ